MDPKPEKKARHPNAQRSGQTPIHLFGFSVAVTLCNAEVIMKFHILC
jgi:hypothetical protein